MMKSPRNLLVGAALVAIVFVGIFDSAFAAEPARFDISEHGAVADGATLNTQAIQSTIDQCAIAGGGTLVIPKGNFVTGSLFLKPGVNVELLDGAVLEGSKDINDYVVMNTRFEGHFSERRMSVLNAEKCDHLRITGPGTLDGNGAAYWTAKSPDGRPRLCFVRDSSDVTVSNMHFLNSATWNLHFYNCKDVTVEQSHFEISKGAAGPSTDGTDIDSCRHVTIRGCSYYVNDDCICLKGNRYDGLTQEPASPPVNHVYITGCTFEHGMGALSLGTEAQKISDVEMDQCIVKGKMPMLRLKMRPDTSGQDYENVNVHDIKLDGTGLILSFELTHGTKVAPQPPRSAIRNVTVTDISGTYGFLGKISANDNTDISDISLKNIVVKAKGTQFSSNGVTGLNLDNVVVNDTPITAAPATTNP